MKLSFLSKNTEAPLVKMSNYLIASIVNRLLLPLSGIVGCLVFHKGHSSEMECWAFVWLMMAKAELACF